MNHDATHCVDLNEKICPKECYRRRLVEDLKTIGPDVPVNWANLRDTNLCPLYEEENGIYRKLQDLKEGNRSPYRKEKRNDQT